MNAKRQTIWLVSMLSLMVVLSAYYLFTEDVNKLDVAPAQKAAPQEVKIDVSDVTGAKTTTKDSTKANVTPNIATDSKVNSKTDAKATTQTTEVSAKTMNSNGKNDASGSNKAAAADAKVLQKVTTQAQATSGNDYFALQQMKRHEDLMKQTDKWMTVLTDSKQTPEAAANATVELQKIQDLDAKIMNLEDVLSKDYPQAIVTQDSNKWRVTVQSNKLEKSQAVSIVDLVMKELSIGPEKIVVQYIP